MDNNSKKVIVPGKLGLHARPAAMIAQLAMKAKSDIRLIKNDQSIDASSIIDILALECGSGTELVIEADHPDDKTIVEKIAALFEKGFTE